MQGRPSFQALQVQVTRGSLITAPLYLGAHLQNQTIKSFLPFFPYSNACRMADNPTAEVKV